MGNQARIQAIIFDLGGVLLRTDDPQPRTALAERLGRTRAELETLVFDNPASQQAERGLVPPEQVWDAISQTIGLPSGEIPAFRKQFFGGDTVDFSLIELLQKLRPILTTALLSNTWIVDLPRFLAENLRITDTFDVIISSAQRQMTKPDRAIFLYALEAVQAAPGETIFVDDSGKNITAAASLGIRTVHFRNPEQARMEILALLGDQGRICPRSF